MAIFGRESRADTQRAAHIKSWIEVRCPLALASVLLGVVSVVDAFTLVVGVMAGVAAIVTGVLGVRQIKLQPQQLGRRLCIAGIALGATGIMMSIVMGTVIYPMLAEQR
jgi:cytochrome c biogenesis factor